MKRKLEIGCIERYKVTITCDGESFDIHAGYVLPRFFEILHGAEIGKRIAAKYYGYDPCSMIYRRTKDGCADVSLIDGYVDSQNLTGHMAADIAKAIRFARKHSIDAPNAGEEKSK